jgi:PHP domain
VPRESLTRFADRATGHTTAARGVSDRVAGGMLTNSDVGELLWADGRDEPGHRGRALERASRAARFWPEEAYQLVDAGRSLTELRAVGPWVSAKIHGWLDDPPIVPEPEETRRGFLTYAEVRRTLEADPRWETDPCGDLQVHTTFSDGSLPLPDMVEEARSVGRSYVAITDHSQTLTIANGMTPDELAEQGRVIDAIDRGLEESGNPFRVLRSIEVDVFADGTLDMLSIGSDAHSPSELEFLSFGMATAALAGIPRERILNYRSVEFVRSWAQATPTAVHDRS